MNLDESILRVINGFAGSSLEMDAVMVAFTALGSTIAVALVWLPLWIGGRRELAFDLLVLVAMCLLVETALKLAVARERPYVVLDDLNTVGVDFLNTASGYSFPSGHATRAFALAAFLIIGLRNRWAVSALAVAAVVSISRIYMGLHWPTDVAAGALIGVVLGCLIEWMGARNRRYSSARAALIEWGRRLSRRLFKSVSARLMYLLNP